MQNPRYFSPDSPDIKMLKGMAELGMPMAICGQIMAAFNTEAIPLAVLRYVFGPLIIHVPHKTADPADLGALPRDVVTKWRRRVDLERLEILCGERPDIVSPAEIWLVVYNATLEQPLRYELSEVYIWAAHRAATAAGLESPLNPPSNIMRVAADADVLEERGRYHHEYRELCRSIIAKVVANSRLERPKRRMAAE